MSSKLSCSLCLTPTNEYENLRNDEGDCSEIYEITIKYFDPKLLETDENADEHPQKKHVLCQSCWLPIKYFNKFQQNVIKTRSLSEKITVVVENDDQDDEIVNHENADNNYKTGDDGENLTFSNDNAYVLPDSVTDYEEQKIIIEEEQMTPVLSEKTVVKMECDDQVDLINSDKNSDDNYKSGDGGEHYACAYENVSVKPDLDTNCKEKQFSCVEEAMSCSLPNQTLIKVECDVQANETVNHKNNDDSYKSGDDGRNFAYSNENVDLNSEPDCEEQEFISNEDDDDEDEDDDSFVYSKPNTINKSKILPRNEQMNNQIKSGYRRDTNEIKLNDDDEKVIGEKDFACKECGKTFDLEVYLKAHIKRMHKTENSCDQNNKAGNSAHSSNKHSKKNAFIEKITLTCDVCSMELDSPVSLNNHMAVFHNDCATIYVCSICGAVKSSAKDVLDHKKWVHERNRKCPYCDKEFKICKDLSEHVAKHTGHDLYQCPNCPQTFRARSSMSIHRKRVHPIEWEKGRQNRTKVPKLDINLAKKQVVV